MTDPSRPVAPEHIWDLFIDELDRQGQAGSAAEVVVPLGLHAEAPSGRRFGELTRIDIDTLAKIAASRGRRGDIVKDIWQQTQRKIKIQARKDAKTAKTG
ncbi:MAG: hypothetical protein ABJC89_23075 [Acidobacteriota bacterium]